MNLRQWIRASVALCAAAVLIVGCARPEDKGGQAQNKDATNKGAEKKDNKHEGWWCDEHGIPEDECSMCNAKVAKAFKDNGDWCKEHKRAMSQCFICNPKQREVYAQKYRDKFPGKEPPEPEDNMPKKDDKPKKDEAK